MILDNIKIKKERLKKIDETICLFNNKITSIADYNKYKLLVAEEHALNNEIVLEDLMEQSEKTEKAKEQNSHQSMTSIVKMNYFKSRKIKVELKVYRKQLKSSIIQN